MNLDKNELFKKYWLPYEREEKIFSKPYPGLAWCYMNNFVDSCSKHWIKKIIKENEELSHWPENAHNFRQAVNEHIQMWKINF